MPKQFSRITDIVDYIFECAKNVYLLPNDKTGDSAILSERSITIRVPSDLKSKPITFDVDINQVRLIRRPASFPAYTEIQRDVNAQRLAVLKVMFESAIEGGDNLSVSVYAENYAIGTIHYKVTWRKS